MSFDVVCPKCHAELEADGRKAREAETFECAACGAVSPMPGLGAADTPTKVAAYTPPKFGANAPLKSSVAAGLLQLFFGFLGLGRFYLGYTAVGVTQLGLWIVGLLMVFLGWLVLPIFSLLGFLILIAVGIWVLVEAIMMIAGAIPDADGRTLA